MPLEASKFSIVDGSWRSVMRLAAGSPAAPSVDKIDGILERLREARTLLDEIQGGLETYLESKRLRFARFFFLSNDELLEILAETKDPTRAQPFLKKCFEGISSLDFDSRHVIGGMRSSEGEAIEFGAGSTVDPRALRNAVEEWLLAVETSMRVTLAQRMSNALAAYSGGPTRTAWATAWPGQLVLNGSQVFWTAEVEAALATPDGLEAYAKTLHAQVGDIVALVRGDLGRLARQTLSALTVIDVHQRDVVDGLAAEGRGAVGVGSFEWTSQLRYYAIPGAAEGGGMGISVRMISSALDYAYEYLGNTGRLVITPLTDRCYRTLMGALQLQYGGAPEGPAGTGKTETTKDLAKALARQCVVFNCSDQLDVRAMGKFFKGLASSGAWACFDEFNRIHLEVLSVIAQQVTSIQRAIAEQKTSFVFEGTTIALKWTANVFITMNPGYAGRSALPDNLKALFRSVAMMVPDYAMIAEITLYSMGYMDARPLAQKIVAMYKLCSEQLSVQPHYDYGMRAVVAVLRAAGALKRASLVSPGAADGAGSSGEDALVLRAIRDVNIAKFLAQDLPLFAGITSDLFPGVSTESGKSGGSDEALEGAIHAVIDRMRLQKTPYFVEKVVQTYHMMRVRHGFVVVGEPLSGKSRVLRVLSTALCDLAALTSAVHVDGAMKTELYVINPKSLSLSGLYGAYDRVTQEWNNGVLAKTFRAAATAPDSATVRRWLVFDGPVDAIWIENMNTVLDDNKKLCLSSGEIIAMAQTMSLVFEPSDLRAASPATVSRIGVIFLEPARMGWAPFVASWIIGLPEAFGGAPVGEPGPTAARGFALASAWRGMFDWILAGALTFVRKSGLRLLVPLGDVVIVANITRVIDSFLDAASSACSSSDENEAIAAVEGTWLFALAWGVGGVLDTKGREAFDTWLRTLLMAGESPEIPASARRKMTVVSPQGSVFEHSFSPIGRGKWVPWSTRVDSAPAPPVGTKLSTLVVPTVDTVKYGALLEAAVTRRLHFVFVGATGTGKSVYINSMLGRQEKTKARVTGLAFSAQTSAAAVQDILESRMDNRRRNERGPPVGMVHLVFVDDLNMPEVEQYGAQPPLELLRQVIDSGGWYDRKELVFKKILDTVFLAAMATAGRHNVSGRVLRHFQVRHVPRSSGLPCEMACGV